MHHQKRLKSNRKMVETDKMYTLNTQIQDCSTFLDCYYSHCNKKLRGIDVFSENYYKQQ